MTTASIQSFSRALLATLLAAGCVDEKPLKIVVSSVDVNITAPTNLGTQASPIATPPTVTVSVQALDSNGEQDMTFGAQLNASLFYLGTLTPLAQPIQLDGGKATATLNLPVAFGNAYLWIDDSLGDSPTYATGTSANMWFRNPYIADVSTPDLTNTATWLYAEPLENKEVTVSQSKYGANGALIATGVFSDGYSLSDVDCTTTPCIGNDFNHVYVYTFGRATDANGVSIVAGDVVSFVSGGVGEFNGFTELNFPQTGKIVESDPSKLPNPTIVQPTWLQSETDPRGMINLEKNESGLVEVDNVKFCGLDSDYYDYSQWKVDLGLGCAIPINVISAAAVQSFNPTSITPGTPITKLVGVLRSVNIAGKGGPGSGFDVWIIYPRSPADITL